ncbi:MAG: hypothetical protein QOD06_3462 [Candidatus Binatota bacterium]|nr:hypothetical protein [Candidatus Binatota bacterium]
MKSTRPPRLSDLIRKPTPSREDDSLPLPPPRSTTHPVEPAAAEPTAPELEARRDYDLLEDWIGKLFSKASEGSFDPEGIFENVTALLERPKVLDALFTDTFRSRPPGPFLPRKSANVGIYALRLGAALGYEREHLVDVGAAGFLHKIGLAMAPPELLSKPGRLSRRELDVIRAHPRIGRELIAAHGDRFENVADIVYQAPERIDGSGYPEGRKGADIRTEALLIGLVDVYEALIQPRPYRERMIPFRAVKELLERERQKFPRALLREFVSAFSVFPPFSYVRLNSKALARVVETEPGHPLRPVVTVVVDASGRKPRQPETLRLRDNPLLHITGPADEDELPA